MFCNEAILKTETETSLPLYLFIYLFFPLDCVWPWDRLLCLSQGGVTISGRQSTAWLTRQYFLLCLKIILTVCTVCHSLQARKAIIYILNQPPLGASTIELSQQYPGQYISNESDTSLIMKLCLSLALTFISHKKLHFCSINYTSLSIYLYLCKLDSNDSDLIK